MIDPLPIDAVLPEIVAKLREHPSLVLRAPTGAGKTTRVPPALLDARLTDGQIVVLEPRRLAARANLLRQRPIGGRAPPANSPQRGVDLGEERILPGEVEPDVREVRFFAVKIPFRRRDNSGNVFRGRARLRAKGAAAHQPLGALGVFRWQLKARHPCVAPGDCAEAHGRLEDLIVLAGFAHCIASRLVMSERCAAEPQIQPDS